MSLERIWAGWRAEYVTNADELSAARGCIMCRLAGAADDVEALVVARDELVFAMMNLYPYTSGHLMVAPVRHEAELDGLTEQEAAATMAMLRRATAALKAAFSPDGLNVGANLGRVAGAGIPDHVHLHVLPRWSGDTNFMTAIAEARVMPEDLRTSYDKLRAAWPY